MPNRRREKRRTIKAWLVTWEWVGLHAAVENPIAAILSPRLSEEHVREIVELLYVNKWMSVNERLSYAKDKRSNPYPAQFSTINGVAWTGQILCGHNPHLFARRVDDLRVEGLDEDGDLEWTERSVPNTNVFR